MKRKISEIKMRDDGKDADRFRTMLKTVVSVPKDMLKKEEERQKKEKNKA